MIRLREKNINTVEYWDKEWNTRPLELLERFRHIGKVVRDSGSHKILDIGCGDGTGYNSMRGSMPGVEYFGSDFSPFAIEKAKEDYPLAHWVEAEYDHQPFDDRSFDAVVSQETIEHLESPQALMEEMKRLASDTVLITAPLGKAMNDVSEHLWEFEPSDFQQAFPAEEWTLNMTDFENIIVVRAKRRLV